MKPIYYNFLFIFFIIANYSNAAQPVDSIPPYQTFTILSKPLAELRTINVWLPANYKNNADSLPVMYMLDGGIKEDFPHLANTLAKLIEEKRIKPLLLVGIENTQRRRDLSGFTQVAKDKKIAPIVGGADKFRTFIKDELFAEVNKRYKTTTQKSIIGESLAGLFIMETLFLCPNMFNNYIAFDPSLWWNNHYLVNTAKEHLSKPSLLKKRLWFAGSNTQDIGVYTKQLANILKNNSFLNLEWMYSDEPKESHATIFRATKEKAIIWTLNK